MPRLVERSFDPRKPLLVRRQFKTAGRTYAVGSPFPWQRLAVDVRRVRNLYDANYLAHEGDDYAPEALEEETFVEDDLKPQQTEGGEQTDPPAKGGEQTVDPNRDADLEIDSLAALQDIATAEGAPIKTSKAAQREAIIAHRDSKS